VLKLVQASVASLILSSGAFAEQSDDVAAEKAFWAGYLAENVPNTAVGYVFVVIRDGEVAFTVEHGLARKPNDEYPDGVPMTADTLIQTSSITKPMTAAAVLQLLERRGMSSEDPIGPILDNVTEEISDSVGALTVQQVLSHTTGLPRATVGGPVRENIRQFSSLDLPPKDDRQIVRSNVNYALAALMIEALSGESYETYMKANIFAPIGITDTELFLDENRFMSSYFAASGKPAEGEIFSFDMTRIAGPFGWYMTTTQMGEFAYAVGRREYFSEETYVAMSHGQQGWFYNDIDPAGVILAAPGFLQPRPGGTGAHTGVAIWPDGSASAITINTMTGPLRPDLLVVRGIVDYARENETR